MRLTHGERLAGTDHMHREQHVVGSLGDLTRPRRARMEDFLRTAHALENRSRAAKGTGRTPAHKGEGARCRCRYPARDRCVHKIDTHLCRSFTNLSRGGGIDGTGVQDQSVFGDRRQQALVAKEGPRHMFASG